MLVVAMRSTSTGRWMMRTGAHQQQQLLATLRKHSTVGTSTNWDRFSLHLGLCPVLLNGNASTVSLRSMVSRCLSTSSSSWPRLESATGRARKRRRRLARKQDRVAASQQEQELLKSDDDSSILNGKVGVGSQDQSEKKKQQTHADRRNDYPWAVLFPTPRNDPEGREVEQPKWESMSLSDRRQQFQRAWILYKSTWEGFGGGGSSSSSSSSTSTSKGENEGNDRKEKGEQSTNKQKEQDDNDNDLEKIADNLKSNVERNLEFTKREGSSILKHAKEQTGIETAADLKVFAAEQMKLATHCLKEFMVGYRKSRDEEIDRVLHEYFQDKEGQDNNSPSTNTVGKDDVNRQRRRRPKQRILQA